MGLPTPIHPDCRTSSLPSKSHVPYKPIKGLKHIETAHAYLVIQPMLHSMEYSSTKEPLQRFALKLLAPLQEALFERALGLLRFCRPRHRFCCSRCRFCQESAKADCAARLLRHEVQQGDSLAAILKCVVRPATGCRGLKSMLLNHFLGTACSWTSSFTVSLLLVSSCCHDMSGCQHPLGLYARYSHLLHERMQYLRP